MSGNEVRERIVRLEWDLFSRINPPEERAECQSQEARFRALRQAQYEAWSTEACVCYLADLTGAAREGRSLPEEKYIRMMARTDPAGYEALKDRLPPVSPRKRRLAEELNGILLEQTRILRAEYPFLSGAGRPLRSSEDAPGETSVETYQMGELLTCSESTLTELLYHVKSLAARGVSYARLVQENSVRAMGYRDLDDARTHGGPAE